MGYQRVILKGAHCTGNQRQGRDNGWVHYIYYTKPIESRAITFQATTDHLMKNRSEIAKTRKELINNQPTRKITRIDEMTDKKTPRGYRGNCKAEIYNETSPVPVVVTASPHQESNCD